MNNGYTPFKLLRTSFTANSSVTVTSDKKALPKDLRQKSMAGKHVKFLKVLGNQASIVYTNNKMFVPLDVILNYKEFNILGEPCKEDTLFIVASQNPHFKVGAVFETSLITVGGNQLAFHNEDDKTIVLDSSYKALRRPLTKADKASWEELGSHFTVKPTQIKKAVQPQVVIESVQDLPTVVEEVKVVIESKPVVEQQVSHSLSNNILDYVSKDVKGFEAISTLVDKRLAKSKCKFTDMKGKSHTTLISCLKANQLYTDNLYLEAVTSVINTELKSR